MANAGVLYFRVLVSTTGYTHFPLCGIFYPSWHRHQIEGTDGFQSLIRKTLAKWAHTNGIANVLKRSVSRIRTRPGPLGRRSCALTTEPKRPHYSKLLYSAVSSPLDRSDRFTLSPDRPVVSDTNSASLGSILAMQ